MTDDGIEVVRTGGSYHLVQLREGAADASLRRCEDCRHMVGHVNWWCNNKAARKAHGTSIPGFADCSFWEAPPVRVPVVERARKAWRRFWA